MDIDGQIFKSI